MIHLQSEQRADQCLEAHLPFPRAHYGKPRLALERRGKSRSSKLLHARVWGVDINGQAFVNDCQVTNISSSGVYLTLPRAMAFSSDISLAVRLKGADGNVTAAIKGTVVRVETRPNLQHGIAVKTSRYSFL